MPQPLVPPPVGDTGALTFPRTLQRWLDVNPVSKLTRTSGFITLPAFSVAQTWAGYSDIVASFNYEGPNNFSLKSLVGELPLSPNYCLCIMWKTSAGVSYRYALWLGVGEVFYFNVPLYTGQKIGKNFRFEVWSTNSTPSVQATALTFYTSVLGKQDYRWANDFQLVGADGINTSFTYGILGTFQPSFHVFGAGTAIINGLYTFTDIQNGYPIYAGAAPDYCLISFSNGAWGFSNNLGVNQYISYDQVVDPTQITHWFYGTQPYPSFATVPPTTYMFSLPLTFPATSQPQPN